MVHPKPAYKPGVVSAYPSRDGATRQYPRLLPGKVWYLPAYLPLVEATRWYSRSYRRADAGLVVHHRPGQCSTLSCTPHRTDHWMLWGSGGQSTPPSVRRYPSSPRANRERVEGWQLRGTTKTGSAGNDGYGTNTVDRWGPLL